MTRHHQLLVQLTDTTCDQERARSQAQTPRKQVQTQTRPVPLIFCAVALTMYLKVQQYGREWILSNGFTQRLKYFTNRGATEEVDTENEGETEEAGAIDSVFKGTTVYEGGHGNIVLHGFTRGLEYFTNRGATEEVFDVESDIESEGESEESEESEEAVAVDSAFNNTTVYEADDGSIVLRGFTRL